MSLPGAYFSARSVAALALGMALAVAGAARAQTQWIGTWAAAPQDVTSVAAPLGQGNFFPSFNGQTLREDIQASVGGAQVRVRFSNLFGSAPLHLAAASIGRRTGPDAMSPATLKSLRFGGKRDVTIPPGAQAWSDPAPLAVQAGDALAVSLYLDRETLVGTAHHQPPNGTRVADGNQVMAPTWNGAARSMWNPFVTGLDVASREPASVVVAFGDGITQGALQLSGLPGDYPSRLAQRLQQQRPATTGRAVAVLNAGIAGNSLLSAGAGASGLGRFERDVLEQSGVTHVIVLIGVEDIAAIESAGRASGGLPNDMAITAQIEAGLKDLMDRSRQHGKKIMLGTLLPFKGSAKWSQRREIARQAVNRWIRGRQAIDGVIDFDAALRSKADPQMLDPRFDSGDHFHPGEAGYAAMASAVDLGKLRK
ncbi:GDSL-type esterase/lipase family protein [Variovorax sp. J22R133]|uniref:GDSL-type esterase/lipase family protein n=1 Tax=Variovorax brevis TaxID=3053503 RepID=UPI0025791F0B|nr:GDSL-type esterase/lipase family protein [Variovorax sp. J22R133]MDM0115725.1 GDSL-type esterase/lipase family protein [Variovorax sp. J22R133]